MSTFMEAAKGRVPLQTGYGSAASMKDQIPEGSPGKGVPRPDVTLNFLRFLSFLGGGLGLDHFYVRSPITGFIKLLLGGGIIASVLTLVYPPPVKSFVAAISIYGGAILGCLVFSFWWIWDIVQLMSEGDRVVNYGLVSPFDLVKGIAQGMVTDKTTNYTQAKSSLQMMLAQTFGFMGFLDLALGNMTKGLRALIIQLFTLPALGFVIYSAIKGTFQFSAGFIMLILYLVIMSIFSLPLFTMWFSNLCGVYEGKTLDAASNVLKYYKRWAAVLGINDTSLEITGVDPIELQKAMMIIHNKEKLTENNPDTSNDQFPFMAAPLAAGGLIKTGLYAMFPLLAAKDALTAKATAAATAATAATATAVNPVGAIQGQAAGLLGQAGNPASLLGQAGNPARVTPAGLAGAVLPPKPTGPKPVQKGGAIETLSTESQILGATVFAIIGGGIMKAVVDNLV
jgi:hypothetical protein